MSDALPPIPHRLAGFEVLRRLGVGGMAEVFLAKKRGAEGTYKLLVVKRILPSFGASRRFRTMFAEEAQLATRLNHPNIVQVYDFQDYGDDGQLLSMEYVEGPDLRKLARAARAQRLRLPPWISAFIAAEVAKGLHYAHEKKDEGGTALSIVHRDVSPQNVLLSYDGVVKVGDFGIATASVFRDEPGVLKGKTGYMSPEQARGERVDRRSDIYSLGIVLHELLTGRPAHGGLEGKELLRAVRHGVLEPPSLFADGIATDLEAIVMRALSRDPSDRFQTARDLASALGRALFQNQQLVDAHLLENVIAALVNREHTSPGLDPMDGAGSAVAPSEGSEDSAPGAWPPERPEESSAPSVADRTGVELEADQVPARVGREVRHVAVVTLRLHGVAMLRERLGPSAARHLMEQLRALLDEVAFKCGARWSWDAPPMTPGNAAQLLPTAARAVVGLLANSARAAGDAASLAVDTHEVIEAACDGQEVELSGSIGIVRGIATGRRDQAGHLVQHALQPPADHLSRLLGEQAPPKTTWVAGGLYRLVRRDFLWEEAPSLPIAEAESRGLPRNMRVHLLVRRLTGEERKEQAAGGPRDLIGRDAELADLHASYHSSITTTPALPLGQLVARLVVGEMGIGKTALVQTFLTELPGQPSVIRLECSPAQSEVPYSTAGLFVREVGGLQPHLPIDEARRMVRASLAEFAGASGSEVIVQRLAELGTGRLALAADEGEAAHNRRLLASGMRRFFAKRALEGPLVVVVDGLQWCDAPSLELISGLAKRRDPVPIYAIFVSRPSAAVDATTEGIVRVELGGLAPGEQVRLVQAHLGADQGVAQVCAELVPKAAGNPFFLLEMVDSLLERGVLELRAPEPNAPFELVRVNEEDGANLVLPSTLEQLIADRISELPPAERVLVEWLAVAGQPLTVAELDALEAVSTEDAVTRLLARGLCDQRGDHLDFRHPLVRDVTYLNVEASQRARMHERLAERALSEQPVQGLAAAGVAHHFSAAGQPAKAALHFYEAATAARNSYQLRLAARYYEAALAGLSPEHPRRLDTLEALETLARIQGRWRERRAHLAALRRGALEQGTPRAVATGLVASARYALDAGLLARGLTLAQEAESAARLGRSPHLEVEAQALVAEMLRDSGDMQGALSACDRALDSAARASVPARLRAEVLRTRGTLLLRVGRVNEAMDAHADAIAIFRRSGARRYEARAKTSLAFAMFVLGHFEDAIALGLEAVRIDLAIGGRFQIARTFALVGRAFARLGDYQRARSYFERAVQAHERYGDQDGRSETFLAAAEVEIEAGDLDSANELVGDAGALNTVTGNAYDSVHERILRALIAREWGDPGTAVMYAFEARQVAETQASVAFHFYAMAIEAASRVDVGEHHTGILLATTALGAIETVQGSDFGIETRALCCMALERAASPQAAALRQRGAEYARRLRAGITDRQLRHTFSTRAAVAYLLSDDSPDAGREPPAPSPA